MNKKGSYIVSIFLILLLVVLFLYWFLPSFGLASFTGQIERYDVKKVVENSGSITYLASLEWTEGQSEFHGFPDIKTFSVDFDVPAEAIRETYYPATLDFTGVSIQTIFLGCPSCQTYTHQVINQEAKCKIGQYNFLYCEWTGVLTNPAPYKETRPGTTYMTNYPKIKVTIPKDFSASSSSADQSHVFGSVSDSSNKLSFFQRFLNWIKNFFSFNFIGSVSASEISQISEVSIDKVYDPVLKEISLQDSKKKEIVRHKLVNSYDSVINGYAEGYSSLYLDGILFDKLDYYDNFGRTSNLRDSKVFIEVNKTFNQTKPIYNYSCGESVNGTQFCYREIIGYEVIPYNVTLWDQYNFTSLPIGVYHWKIIGQKMHPNQKVDWVFTSQNISLSEWDWWNSTFDKYKKITITENSGSSGVDFRLFLNVTYDSDMQTDFDDVRFVDSDNTTELDYKMYFKSDSNWAVFYVPINITASSTKYIYMYYNNSGVSTTSQNISLLPSSLSSGVVAYYRFDEKSGDCVDYQNLYNGSLTGEVVQGIPGHLYGSYSFDGDQDHVDTTVNLTKYSAYTVTFWAKYNDTGDYVFAGQDKSGARSFVAGYNTASASGQKMNFYDGQTSLYGNDTGANTWVHLAVIQNSTGFFIFQNGAQINSAGGNIPVTSTTTLWLGGREYSGVNSWLKGALDDVIVYNKGITPEQVSLLYNMLSPDPTISYGSEQFYDEINPNVTITSPSGSYTDKTITINVSASDNIALSSCYYNITRGASAEVSNTFLNITSQPMNDTQTLSSFADYVIHVVCNDTAGNINETNSSFSVTYVPPVAGGGGGGGALNTQLPPDFVTIWQWLQGIFYGDLKNIQDVFYTYNPKTQTALLDAKNDLFNTNSDLSYTERLKNFMFLFFKFILRQPPGSLAGGLY